jgi:2-alkyl-3-oxoalkanoate reductase
MRVLVTGGSGFVASAICRALVAADHDVTALTRAPERAQARVGEKIKLVQGSCADPREVAEAARGAELVYHAAGIASVDAPAEVLRWVHVAGTENVLRGARYAKVRRVVHVSCADVSLTGEDRMHWDEKRAPPTLPVGPHARTKLMAEELALAQSNETLEVVALRPALLWGPDDVDGLARLVRSVRGGEFTLYGGGRNIVATTHIDNLVKAALLAASAPEAVARSYYVTDGEFLEAREFYTRLFGVLGLPAPKLGGSLQLALLKASVHDLLARTHGSTRAEVLKQGRSALFDVSRATLELNYEAKLDLDARLRELGEWVQKAGGLDAVLARERARPSEAEIAEQVRAAGGE